MKLFYFGWPAFQQSEDRTTRLEDEAGVTFMSQSQPSLSLLSPSPTHLSSLPSPLHLHVTRCTWPLCPPFFVPASILHSAPPPPPPRVPDAMPLSSLSLPF